MVLPKFKSVEPFENMSSSLQYKLNAELQADSNHIKAIINAVKRFNGDFHKAARYLEESSEYVAAKYQAYVKNIDAKN